MATEEKKVDKRFKQMAHFRSLISPSLRLVKTPIKETYFPGGGFRVDRSNAEEVQFDNYLYKTDNKKMITWLMKHNQWEVEYGPDPLDPSGYWKESGWFEEKSTKYLVPAEKQEAVIASAKEQVKKQMEETGDVVVGSLRTSNSGASVPK